MITLTANAVEKAKEILKQEQKDNWGLRVGLKQGGCSGFSYVLGIDEKALDQDSIIEVDGLKVFVNSTYKDLLEGVELDYINDLNGAGFKFSNPNASRSCGCGNSFDA